MHAHHHGGSCDRSTRGHHGGFGPHGFKHPFGIAGHLHGFARGGRARRGDVRTGILRLLAEQPMHGYQIIQEISSRSAGAWSPSAGSIYPALQLLADEGLVTSEETAGKRVFDLTDAGKAAVAETADQPTPWDEAAQGDSGAGGLREAAGRLMPAIFQIGKAGSTDQVTAAIAVLNDARKKLYAILAED
ncbi:MAG: PadR family transcriptional regulator [Thermoleophilia bacterium]